MVRITVWRMPELTGEFLIATDGSITHPVYRQVQVTGVPLATAEDRVRTLLRRYDSNPQFAMQSVFRVAVGGEVRQPNLYSLTPETTIAQAVALAGGLTERGRLDRVRLVREGRVMQLDLGSPDAQITRMPVRSGDQIIIERQARPWYEFVAPITSTIAAVVTIVNLATR
jgi:polysaccharide export outer membrane protein